MSEKQLLLPSANAGALRRLRAKEYLYFCMLAVGTAVVLVGAASILSNLAHSALGEGSAVTVFGPAISLIEPLTGSSATQATTTPIVPAELRIPSLGIQANVEQVGKKADGSMATPTTFMDVGWYMLGSRPGEAGSAVIAGHVNNALTRAGVFEHLSQIKVGDYIEVSDLSGKTLVYMARETAEYPANEAPLASIFSTEGPSQIVLITCDGDWSTQAHSFDKRFVVYARFVKEQ